MSHLNSHAEKPVLNFAARTNHPGNTNLATTERMKSKKDKDKKDKKGKDKDKKGGKGTARVVTQATPVVNFWEIAGTNNTHQLQNAALAKGIGPLNHLFTLTPQVSMPEMPSVVHSCTTQARQEPLTW